MPAPDLTAIEAALGRAKAQYRDLQPGRCAERECPGLVDARTKLAREIMRLEAEWRAARERRRRDLAAIHIGIKTVGLDEEVTRAIYREISGGRAASSGDLSAKERQAALRWLDERGYKSRRGRKPAGGRAGSQPAPLKAALAARVAKLLADAGRADAYADAIARSRFACERWVWLEYPQLKALAQMLTIDARRRAKRAQEGGAP